MNNSRSISFLASCLLLLLSQFIVFAAEIGSAFLYQGRLNDGVAPANGAFDFEFHLWTQPTNGVRVGSVSSNAMSIGNGLLTVELNFGSAAFDGSDRWLEILVQAAGGPGFVTLQPRQRVTATPYALRANHSATAQLALGVPAGSITSSMLGTGAVATVNLASNSVTAAQLAPGAAAANLGGAVGVPITGVVLSEKEINPDLLNGGFSPVGTSLTITGEVWVTLSNGPPATGALNPGRYNHRAVWTGTEMLIIGGTPDNLGLRYNPSANSWSVMNKTNAPPIGEDVIAVWTGTQMLVWDAEHRLGGRYTPSSDSWVAMSDTNAPSARRQASGALAGGYFVVWGGHELDSDVEVLNTGARYNPTNNTWTTMSTAGAPLRRALATATAIGSDIIFFGGATTNVGIVCPPGNPFCPNPGFEMERVATETGGRYNPAANSWTAIADAPDSRAGHSATWSGADLYVWGGRNSLEPGLRYNPAGNSWTTLPTNGQPVAVRGHTAVWSGSSLNIWGGETLIEFCFFGCSYVSVPTNSGTRFVPASNSWVPMAPSPAEDRAYHSAVWTGTQMILFGGRNENHEELSDGFRYSQSGNSWTATATPPASGEPSERSDATAVWIGDALIVWGGISESVALRSGGIYRPGKGWTNTPIGGAPSPRYGHTAVWTGTDMIVWGGFSGFGTTPLNSGARFNVSSNRWFPISSTNAPRKRGAHVATWTGTEMIIWGGIDYTNLFSPTYLTSGARYNPVTDTWTPLPAAPLVARGFHTAVWTGDEMLIWGGHSSSGGFFPTFNYFSSGAAYRPASNFWRLLPSSGLAGRSSHTAVWTGDEMIVWGGRTSAGPTNNGARYHPTSNSWTALPATNQPAGRYLHTAVWADNVSQMIVWGGDSATTPLGTGGLYDPLANKWTTMSIGGGVRYNHVAAWTGTNMIVFDGNNGSVDLSSGAAYTPRKVYYLYFKQ